MADPITIEFIPHPPEVTVVRIIGSLDRNSAPKARSQLVSAIETGPPTMILDVHHVPSVDGAGVQTLVYVLHRARRAGRDLRVAAVADPVKQRLAVAGLDQVLPIHDTVVDALAAVS